jgi:8-oxo-dGTP pyrophosphatase MutT (NUDIX family)
LRALGTFHLDMDSLLGLTTCLPVRHRRCDVGDGIETNDFRAGKVTRTSHQTAALPVARDRKGRLTVLMVTSRDTGRWVLPKGWLMDDAKPWQAAEIEALEEAGAKGQVARKSIGIYGYDKRLDDGSAIPCRVQIFPMRVDKLKRVWKERRQRKRRWFSPSAAARRVDEADLAALLRRLEDRRSDEHQRLMRILDTG